MKNCDSWFFIHTNKLTWTRTKTKDTCKSASRTNAQDTKYKTLGNKPEILKYLMKTMQKKNREHWHKLKHTHTHTAHYSFQLRALIEISGLQPIPKIQYKQLTNTHLQTHGSSFSDSFFWLLLYKKMFQNLVICLQNIIICYFNMPNFRQFLKQHRYFAVRAITKCIAKSSVEKQTQDCWQRKKAWEMSI